MNDAIGPQPSYLGKGARFTFVVCRGCKEFLPHYARGGCRKCYANYMRNGKDWNNLRRRPAKPLLAKICEGCHQVFHTKDIVRKCCNHDCAGRAQYGRADSQPVERFKQAAVSVPMSLLSSLSQSEKLVLQLRPIGKTLREIGERLNVSRERVRQIEHRLLRKLKVAHE
jgi:DNA-binding CsgD family transcriptional regulator